MINVGEFSIQEEEPDITVKEEYFLSFQLKNKKTQIIRSFVIEITEQPVLSAKYKLYPDRNEIKILLKKKFKIPWKKLKGNKTQKFDPEKFRKREEQKKDPVKNIHGMLEGLYKSGNPEMKQMIEKAWSKSENKYKNMSK